VGALTGRARSIRILTPGGGGFGAAEEASEEASERRAAPDDAARALPLLRSGGSLADWKARSESA